MTSGIICRAEGSGTSHGFIGLSIRQNGNKRKQQAKEDKMNTKIVLFFSLLLSMSLLSCGTASESSKAVPPGARIVELSIPMCWPGDDLGVSFTLESIDGVYKTFASLQSLNVKIWYDEKRTDVNAFSKKLKDTEYYVTGAPKFLN